MLAAAARGDKDSHRTMPGRLSRKIVDDLVTNRIGFVTTVPCKHLAGLIEGLEASNQIMHVPSTKEDEGMGLCAGAYMGGTRPAIVMQNTALGVTVNALATLIQFYQVPLPMLISYRGELGEPVACQVEMALHTKPLLQQLGIPSYHLRAPAQVEELDAILKHTQMCKKPTAVLMDAGFWEGDT